ncbi:hypothetical protein [Streptomyces sp. NPDC095613]|uniref:hypothetical protein n=1 Tax=Streptomyces sp. NPDC095613 TaxID=3155540 RepID=UPI00331A1EB6
MSTASQTSSTPQPSPAPQPSSAPQLSLTPGQPDLYLAWLRGSRPYPPGEQAAAESAAEELMAYVRDEWAPKRKVPDRSQVKYFADLDARVRDLPPSHLPYFWDAISHRYENWHATGAYRRARAAEREHHLPVDADYLVANALFLTGRAGMWGDEQATHLRWLQEAFEPARAHAETVRFLTATAAHNYLEPPENLAGLIRDCAGAAGFGLEEDARLLGIALTGQATWRATAPLLTDAAEVFARARPDEETQRRLLGVYPGGNSDVGGKPMLTILKNSGAFDAMADGRVTPKNGCAGWLTGFVKYFTYYMTKDGRLKTRIMPPQLYPLLKRLAERLRAEGVPVRAHYADSDGSGGRLDARLAETCLELGIPMEDPGPGGYLVVPPRRKDEYARLRADPVLGPRVAAVDFRPGSWGKLA